MRSTLLATTLAVGTLFAAGAFAQTTGGSSGSTGGTTTPGSTAQSPTSPTSPMPGSTTGSIGTAPGSTDSSGTMTPPVGATGSAAGMGAAAETGMSSEIDAAEMSSDQLMKVQQALKDAGQDLTVDGIWGPGTQQALRAYQEEKGLEARGDLDAETMASLGVQPESEVGLGGSSSTSGGSMGSSPEATGSSSGSSSSGSMPDSTGSTRTTTESPTPPPASGGTGNRPPGQ